MGVGGLSSDFFFRLMEKLFEIVLIHKVFGELFWGDGFVGDHDIGGEFGGVIFPVGVIIDGPECIREVGSDKKMVFFFLVNFGVFVFHNDYFIYITKNDGIDSTIYIRD